MVVLIILVVFCRVVGIIGVWFFSSGIYLLVLWLMLLLVMNRLG